MPQQRTGRGCVHFKTSTKTVEKDKKSGKVVTLRATAEMGGDGKELNLKRKSRPL